MNSINIDWDSTKRAETPYFYCSSSGQNEIMREKGKLGKKPLENEQVKGKYTNIYAYELIHTPTDI